MNQSSEHPGVTSDQDLVSVPFGEHQFLKDFAENITYGRLRLTAGVQFHLSRQKSNRLRRLDHLFNRLLFRSMTPRTAGLALLSLLAWPFSNIFYALRQTRRFGPRIKRKTSKSLRKQFLEQLTLVFRDGMPAYCYYQYELFNDEKFRQASDIILPFVAQAAIYPLINSSPRRALLENKNAFHDLCDQWDLPMPQRIWVFGKEWPVLPKADLMSKPILGGHGEGIRKWTLDGDCWIASDGQRCTAAELFELLMTRSVENPQLLERHMANANTIADLGRGVLTTVRLITCLDRNHQPVPVQAIIRIPTKSDDVDNIGRQGRTGGIAASVDLRSGVLGSARRVYRNSRLYAYHPGSGAPIRGRELPFWDEAKALAIRAHETAFPELALVGWDIGLTDDGPVIIEGNWTPSLRSLQAASGIPTGRSPLGELLTFHLEQAEKEFFGAK